MRLIAFTGAAGSGKSTAADYLVSELGFTRIRFAGPLKAMMRALGLSEREIEGDLKETPCARLMGRTPRHAMQTLGTEWGRQLLAPDFWVDLWRQDAERILHDSGRVVVDDCRFPNEASVIHSLGGKIIAIRRDGLAHVPNHASETQQIKPDYSVFNEGLDKGVLSARVAGVLEMIGEAHV